MKRLILACASVAVAVLACCGGLSSANASGTATLDLYFSPPFVQGSEISGDSESFNAFSTGSASCAASWGSVGSATGDCNVNAADSPGGATAGPTDYSATVGGSGSNYAATPWTGHTTLWAIDTTFTAPVKYVGFWWSAGNGSSGGGAYTNNVDFYSGDTLVATMTADDVTSILGTLPNPFPGSDTVTNVAGGSYLKGYYFGNPRGYPSTTPTEPLGNMDYSGESVFVYLNLFVDGDYTIDRMVISGDGFEFDNVVTSTSTQVPSDDLVLAKTIDVTPPTPPTPDPTPGPTPDNGGLPDTGIAALTFAGVALLGAFLFLLAGGAFNSRTRLRLFGVDLEVKEKLDRLSQSLSRMERKRPRIRPRDED